MNSETYDIIIVGAGPAGLTAAIFACRGGAKVLVLEEFQVGGQLLLADIVENYPGFSKITGVELAQEIYKQAKKEGAEILIGYKVKEIRIEKDLKIVETEDGSIFKAYAVIIASGSKHNQLGLKNEKELVGKGISYCAYCDGNFFKDKDVAVVGGGNTAVTYALYLANIAKKVYLIHRRDSFRAEKVLVDRLKNYNNIELVLDTVVQEIIGKEKLEKIIIKNLKTNEIKELKIDGLFVAVGRAPNTDFVNVKKNEKGEIITNENMETSEPGIFAAGDCRENSYKLLVTAVSDGAIAALNALKYVEKIKRSS